ERTPAQRGCSPRTRGWSPRLAARIRALSVLPAHAGMVPTPSPTSAESRCAPRARGDGPAPSAVAEILGGMDRTDRESVFVGREAELAALRDDARRALRDGATAVLVAGEAGVGKSRLVREYAAGSPMSRTVVGGCPELGVDGLPFAP